MKNLILTLIITLPLTLWGQGWEQTYDINNETGYSVDQTQDGGFIITGFTNSGLSPNDVLLIKTDINGNELWTKTFGGTEGDIGRFVQQTNDGGYIITGSTDSSVTGGTGVYLIKTDGNGNEVWSQTYGDTIHSLYGNSIQQTNDGGYIITGYRIGSIDLYLLKVNSIGDEIWSKIISSGGGDYGNSVLQNSDGDYIVTGSISDGNNITKIRLTKIDESGNEIWTQMFGETDPDIGESVQQTTDGGYIITGWTYSFGNGGSDVWLIKTDGNGNEQWNKTFGGSSNEIGRSVQQTNDGGYIITGSTDSSVTGGIVVYLIKTDGNGNEVWSQTYGGTDISVGYSVQQTSDGGYIITGETYNGIDSDVYLIKTDDQGNITSTFEIPLPNPNRKLEKTVNIKGQEIKPQTNTPIIEIFDDGTSQKKIIIE